MGVVGDGYYNRLQQGMRIHVFYEQPQLLTRETRRLGVLALSHLGSAFLWELERGRGLNETGLGFFCDKSPVHTPAWHRRSSDCVKVPCRIICKANALRGCGLKMPHKAQVIKKAGELNYKEGIHLPPCSSSTSK